MLVSVLMPSYNDQLFIADSINSVIRQSFEKWELIVIDASTDGTPEIVKQFADKDSRIKYIREQEGGQLNALKYGAQFVEGDVVTLFHSDDEMTDDGVFARNVQSLARSNCEGLYCDLILMNENGDYAGVTRTPRRIDFSSLATLFLLAGSNIIPDFFFVTKEAFASVFSSYMTWGVPYWLKIEDSHIGTLSLRKVPPWYKYRVYSGNYGHSEIGKFHLVTGGMRSIMEIGSRIDLPLLRLQARLQTLSWRFLKTRFRPVYWRNRGSFGHLRAMMQNIPKLYHQTNSYYDAVLGFYSNYPSTRNITLNISEEDRIFRGNDTPLFFELLEKQQLPEIYMHVLNEAAKGFGKVIVRNKDEYEKARDMMRFLNLLTNVEVNKTEN